jgi:hypothetical protein
LLGNVVLESPGSFLWGFGRHKIGTVGSPTSPNYCQYSQCGWLHEFITRASGAVINTLPRCFLI